MEEIIVRVGYKPKESKAKHLRQMMREHLPALKQQNLVRDGISIWKRRKKRSLKFLNGNPDLQLSRPY